LNLKYEDSEDPQVEPLLCFWDSGILRFSCFPRHTGAWSQRSARSPPEAMAMAMCATVVSVLVQFLWIFWSLAPHLRQAELDAGEVMPSAPGSNFLSDSWRHSWHSSESSLVLNIFGFFGRCSSRMASLEALPGLPLPWEQTPTQERIHPKTAQAEATEATETEQTLNCNRSASHV